MNPALAVALLSALAIPLSAGCEVGQGVPLEPEDVPGAFAAALCEYYVRCRLAPDADTCLASIRTPPRLVGRLASLRFGQAVYRADRMADCIDRTRMASCTVWESSASTTGCTEAFQQTTTFSNSCVDDHDCASGYCIVSPCAFQCCSGFCSALAGRVPVGGGCASSHDCIRGSFCGPARTCDAGLTEGAACTNASPCQAPLFCYSGICRLLPARGETCDPALAVYACDRLDDYCDPQTRICLARGGDGEPCSVSGEMASSGDTCAYDAWCDGGTCRSLPTVGLSCAAAPHCLLGLSCDLATRLCGLDPKQQICQL